ncbi:hypothetical protein B0T24DRAFT_643726 [Lasiosphaeria ovina]|uniref:Secreted protein n=1 Tax=Lasiosphaeria ovina TaxID=92902 RepID=A0AAE0JTN7_9PEZI|nr:hypothetical protein B0T24DRAFT_643726 [Lasiosphaeria ovina]
MTTTPRLSTRRRSIRRGLLLLLLLHLASSTASQGSVRPPHPRPEKTVANGHLAGPKAEEIVINDAAGEECWRSPRAWHDPRRPLQHQRWNRQRRLSPTAIWAAQRQQKLSYRTVA